MLSRWTDRLFRVLSAHLRRGALFVLAVFASVTLTLTPVLSQPAGAQGLSDLLSLGGSLTNSLGSCAIQSVGWVVCPTMRTIAQLADYGFTYINQSFLRIDYSIASNSSGTYTAWGIMRNIANALFVVAFMILIYSQLTGRAGNYTVKRLLPKLLISAILVNISYYLCVAIIDVMNILGDSILNILTGIASKVGNQVMPIGKIPTGDGTLTTITTSTLGKTTGAWVLLAPIAAVITSVAVITSAGIVLLIARKTIIALLILASPILFVAFLLPNLERFFFQGTRLFIQLLLLFPVIALLLGAGQIVSATIDTAGGSDANYRVSGDSYFSMSGGSGSAITDLTAAAAAVMPLLAVWFIFKNMSQLMSTAGARLSASVSGRRGGSKNDEKAKVTGNAVAGAASKIGGNLGGPFNRRQAFSRNRRRSSASGSSLTGEGDGKPLGANGGAATSAAGTAAAAAAGAAVANRQSAVPLEAQTALADALQSSIQGQVEDTGDHLEELSNAKLDGEGNNLDIKNAMNEAISKGTDKENESRKLTAKDLFNNLNHAHESKDKDRKFGAGPGPAGGGGGNNSSGGGAQPHAPASSYRAPGMAQSGNIISGNSLPQQPTKIIAVPVQIDASALLGQKNQIRPPDNVTQPPISGTEEKAKARAQKYLFDAEKDVDDARAKIDILGHKDTPIEPPHTTPDEDNKDKGESH